MIRRYPKTFALLSLFWIALAAFDASAAEESVRTPSEQMKEAVNKLARTPAAIRKSLENLTDAVRPGGQTDAERKNESREDKPDKTQPQNKAMATPGDAVRDPFRPVTMRGKIEQRPRENLSPLERLELSQLKLVAIVWDIQEPRAMVEDTAGLGYVLKVGMPIGSNNGKVKTIERNRVVVEETLLDMTGVPKKHDVMLRLSSE
jgi:type IV pilus assembly protein PilP